MWSVQVLSFNSPTYYANFYLGKRIVLCAM